MQAQFSAIRSKLAQLAATPEELLTLGTEDEHGYQLAPPLQASHVSAWEQQHGVELPADYRAFLLEVGSAGSGPGYGLEPLGNRQHQQEDAAASSIGTPFPLREFFDVSDNPDQLTQAQLYSDQWVTGTLCLCHHGCGIYDLLVITGEERGHIWTDDRSNSYGIFPTMPNREQIGESCADTTIYTIAESREDRITFLEWYEWWLDWMIEELKNPPEELEE